MNILKLRMPLFKARPGHRNERVVAETQQDERRYRDIGVSPRGSVGKRSYHHSSGDEMGPREIRRMLEAYGAVRRAAELANDGLASEQPGVEDAAAQCSARATETTASRLRHNKTSEDAAGSASAPRGSVGKRFYHHSSGDDEKGSGESGSTRRRISAPPSLH